jgi:hypothetical protein
MKKQTHKITFRDEVLKGETIYIMHIVDNYKKYNTPGPDDYKK